MKIYISECKEVKSGVNSKGKKWTLYAIKDQNGNRYSTFEEKYAAMVGMEVEVEVEETESEKINQKTGKPYINKTIIEAGKRKKGGNDKEQLDRIERKLDALMRFQGMTDKSVSL